MTALASPSAARPDRPAAPDAPAGGHVHVQDLARRFGDYEALGGVSLSVAAGDMVGLLGPNGSGKSTLLRVLATLLPPTAGQATVAGHDVVREPAAVRRALGVVFQAPSLDGKLSVLENLRFQGYLYGLAGRTLRQRCEAGLARFGLEDRARQRVETLSGGLKRRVELAKALLHEPRVLLLDEPSTGLDPAAREEFWRTVAGLRAQSGLTILVATHLMDEAERCNRVALLDGGRLIAEDAPAALKTGLGRAMLSVETAEPEALARRITERFGVECVVEALGLRVESAEKVPTVAELMDAFGDHLDGVRVGRPTLADVYLKLTGRHFTTGDSS